MPAENRDARERDRQALRLRREASRLFDALVNLLIRGEPRRDAAAAASGEPALADRHPRRILVAEDNGANQRVVLAMLRRLGYHADLAANGQEAVDAVRQRPYDVVLMDQTRRARRRRRSLSLNP